MDTCSCRNMFNPFMIVRRVPVVDGRDNKMSSSLDTSFGHIADGRACMDTGVKVNRRPAGHHKDAWCGSVNSTSLNVTPLLMVSTNNTPRA